MEQEGPAPGTEGPLAGKTFVITGTLPNMSRERAAEAIEEAGGKVTNSVSKKTDYLVVGADPGGSKFNKAQEIGTEQIDEAALVGLLGGLSVPGASAAQPPQPASACATWSWTECAVYRFMPVFSTENTSVRPERLVQ